MKCTVVWTDWNEGLNVNEFDSIEKLEEFVTKKELENAKDEYGFGYVAFDATQIELAPTEVATVYKVKRK